jgi:hypothetical protein
MSIQIQEHNAETNEIVIRPATQEEAKAIEAAELATAERIANETINAQAKAGLLERLGITAEEAELLLS